MSEEQFGIIDSVSLEPSSLILNDDEVLSLNEMTHFKNGTLLYRATRDGFNALAIHSKCEGRKNTVVVIKTDKNHVFGGFSPSEWNSSFNSFDASAFVFNLRRAGISTNEKFLINPQNNSFGHSNSFSFVSGFQFGNNFGIRRDGFQIGNKIFIIDNSNSVYGSDQNIDNLNYHAGIKNNWLTLEIEVYELTV